MQRPVTQLEEQPQVIASPDGKLQIIHHRPYMQRMGGYCVQGAVKYISPEPNLYAEIKVDYYDIDRELIDTEVDTVNFREIGKTTAFHIMYSGPRRWEIQYYKLYMTAKKRA